MRETNKVKTFKDYKGKVIELKKEVDNIVSDVEKFEHKNQHNAFNDVEKNIKGVEDTIKKVKKEVENYKKSKDSKDKNNENKVEEGLEGEITHILEEE